MIAIVWKKILIRKFQLRSGLQIAYTFWVPECQFTSLQCFHVLYSLAYTFWDTFNELRYNRNNQPYFNFHIHSIELHIILHNMTYFADPGSSIHEIEKAYREK